MKMCPRLLIFELSDCSLKIFKGYDFSTQFYRIKGGGGSGRPPTDNFLTVNFTPTNYISLEREFHSE